MYIDTVEYEAAHGTSPKMADDGVWRFTDTKGGGNVVVEYTGEFHNAETAAFDHFGDETAYLMP